MIFTVPVDEHAGLKRLPTTRVSSRYLNLNRTNYITKITDSEGSMSEGPKRLRPLEPLHLAARLGVRFSNAGDCRRCPTVARAVSSAG